MPTPEPAGEPAGGRVQRDAFQHTYPHFYADDEVQVQR
jgi:hypothetical protein